MTKYITVIVAVALLFCFSGKAYCLSLGNLQQVVQQAASAAGNRASRGTSNKSANNSSPLAVANVQDDGVFYTAEAASPTEKRSEPFTVFDIPLNASPQEVFNVIEKKGMDFREGCFNDKREMEKFSENGLRDLVSRYYEAQGISGASKEAALKVIDEGKIKFYPFTFNNRQYGLYPQSLDALFKSNLKPVFDKYYNVYTSQTMIEVRHLSEDMKSQGVIRAYILFGRVNQEEPRSYLISLQFGMDAFNPKLAAILNKKYGLPKAYPYIYLNQEQWSRQDMASSNAVLTYLKSKSASYEEKGRNEFIYKIPKFLAIDDSEALDQISRPLMAQYTPQLVSNRHANCIFEWNQDDTKILADFDVDWTPSLALEPSVIDYVYFPLATKISDGVEEAMNASKQMSESVQSTAEKSF